MIAAGSISCKKLGCTDPNAVNYLDEANHDDGTCTYESNVVWWWNNLTADYIYNVAGSDTLHFYVNGFPSNQTIGYHYWDGEPKCDDNGIVKWTRDLGKTTSASISWSIRNENETLLYSGTLNMKANTCHKVKVGWE